MGEGQPAAGASGQEAAGRPRCGVKLWIDECLSPTLVERANLRGYWATCNRDRNLLGVRDGCLTRSSLTRKLSSSRTTRPISTCSTRQVDLHTGLLILPQAERREALWPLLDAALDYIEQQASGKDETPAEWMLNKRVEAGLDGSIKHSDLPE